MEGIRGWAKIWVGTRIPRMGGYPRTVVYRFRPYCIPVAPFSLSPVKFIWQCYSELCPLAKNTLAVPLEVKVFCPYLCTTPQGRDGRRATDNREGKGMREGQNWHYRNHRKKTTKKYLKKDFAVSEKVPTFAVPTKGNSDGRDVRSGKK